MPGTNKHTPPCPAQWIGGQRRKLVRRNRTNAGLPRSSTMPVVNPGSATANLVGGLSNANSYCVQDRQKDSFDQYVSIDREGSEGIEGSMQFYPPSGEIRSGVPYTAFADDCAKSPPKLTATNSKRKQRLFGSKKPQPLDLLNSSPREAVVTSPLPVTTPSKAAKFFGVEVVPTAKKNLHNAQLQDDGNSGNVAKVRPAPTMQYFLPLMTIFKTVANRQAKSDSEDFDSDKTEPGKTCKAIANRELSSPITKFADARRSPVQQNMAARALISIDEDEGGKDIGYSSDSGLLDIPFRIPPAPRPPPNPPKRYRARNKALKDFRRMSPITEASYESLRPTDCDGEDVTTLGVISEYDYDDTPHSAPLLLRSRSEMALSSHDAFELDEADLSPTDQPYGDRADNEDGSVHPGIRVDLRLPQATTLYFRSPLQTVEDAYLDATEEDMRLQARMMTIARVEAEKQAMDAEIAVLRGEHERLRLGLEDGSFLRIEPEDSSGEDSIENDSYLVSLSSSIDFDEKPKVMDARAITFTSITSEMVNLVDVPSRDEEPVDLIDRDAPGSTKCVAATTPAFAENTSPPIVTHYHYQDLDDSASPETSNLSRNESRLLVQKWISDYHSTEQRPVSTRVDPDVLADQETPPAPFPKSDEAMPTAPFKSRSSSLKLSKQQNKHYCINNGHIFHPIDLNTVPDNALINSLEVRPYLQTYSGIKQHVKIPVPCEKCSEDCDENVWECEIAVCRMAVCQSCAEDMEAEWQERAVNGWKYK